MSKAKLTIQKNDNNEPCFVAHEISNVTGGWFSSRYIPYDVLLKVALTEVGNLQKRRKLVDMMCEAIESFEGEYAICKAVQFFLDQQGPAEQAPQK